MTPEEEIQALRTRVAVLEERLKAQEDYAQGQFERLAVILQGMVSQREQVVTNLTNLAEQFKEEGEERIRRNNERSQQFQSELSHRFSRLNADLDRSLLERKADFLRRYPGIQL